MEKLSKEVAAILTEWFGQDTIICLATMAYVISDDCVMCGTCAGECPSGAISEGDGKYVIDADACVDCGTCADACPAGAISAGE